MIFYNQLYQYVNNEKENRIRIIELDDSIVYYVELNGDTAMPKKISLKTLEDEIDAGVLLAISDPFFTSHDDKNLTPKQIEKRDEDWEVISSTWEDYKWQLLEKKTRDLAFDQIAEKFNLKKLKVKRLFTRFWQRGLNKNALLPDYNKSGGKGKERNLASANKVGRPRKYGVSNEKEQGINITDDVK
ncbi:MAG TPA: transposase, partial [Flavobacteriaceae bacterium]|nr:transposase [Flavobacteriaceae bacterium]